MSSAIDVLKARWERMTLAGEAGWLGWLVIALLTGGFGVTYPLRNESLGVLVEIPPSLIDYLQSRNIVITHGPAMLGHDYLGNLSYTYFLIVISFSVCVAALRGRWIMYYACLALMFIPASWFGTVRGDMNAMAFLAAILAGGRCLFTRQFKQLPQRAGVALAAAFLLCFTFLPSRSGLLTAHRQPNAAEQASNRQLFAALDAVSPEFQPQARYVRAQMAYVARDWPALKAVGVLDAGRIDATAFTARRLQVLRQTVHDLARPDYTNPWEEISFWIHMALLSALMAYSVIVARLRMRLGRITRMQTDMDALPPLRHTLRELQA